MAKQTKKTAPLKNIVNRVVQKTRAARAELRENNVHRSFRLSRKSELPELKKMPSWWQLLKRTFIVIMGQKTILLVLLLTYLVLSWSISGIFALSGFSDMKGLIAGGQDWLTMEGVGLLFGSFFTAQSSGVNETALIILNLASLLFWLAFIWVARYEIAQKYTSVREALYTSGMALVPFLLLLAILFVQLVPGFYGLSLLSTIAAGSLFTSSLEVVAFTCLAILLVVFSVYFLVSTVTALQIVTLPGMYPWVALKNARVLLAGRRFSVLRKYTMLVIVLTLAWFALFAPVLLLESWLCGEASCWVGITILPFVYYALIGFTIAVASTYLYVTYRSLLELQES